MTVVLFDVAPYARLQFESLRSEKSWPIESIFTRESVGLVYMSPVDKRTSMIGDIGLAVYKGEENQIIDHIKTCRDMVIAAAELAEIGMEFRELFHSAISLFKKRGGKVIGWMTTNHDPLKLNLGHTAPGSYQVLQFGDAFEQVRETIRTKRLYINELETFKIPETCAFTVEARLTDESLRLPNAFFHVIVTFSQGKKGILTDFDGIFKAVGMDYML